MKKSGNPQFKEWFASNSYVYIFYNFLNIFLGKGAMTNEVVNDDNVAVAPSAALDVTGSKEKKLSDVED